MTSNGEAAIIAASENVPQEVFDQHGEGTNMTALPITVTREQLKARKEKLKEIANLDPKKGTKVLGVQYWNASEGDTLTGIFIGWQLFNSKDDEGVIHKKVTAIIDTEQGTYGCNTIQFVEKFRQVPIDTAVHIVCTRSKPREMKEYDITILKS